MTISSEVTKIIDQGNGATTAFAYNFLIPTTAEGTVIYTDTAGTETVLVVDVDYSITGVNNPAGGTVTYPLTGSPAALGTTITIMRLVAYTQEDDFDNQGGFYPEAVEAALDQIVYQTQQLAEVQDRSLVFPPSDPPLIGVLPAAAERADGILGFDSAGNVAILVGSITSVPVSSFGASLVAAASASAVRILIAAAGTGVSNSFSANQAIVSTVAGAGVNPVLTLYRDKAASANDLIGAINFDAHDSLAGNQNYAIVGGKIMDPTSGSEDGILYFKTTVAGTPLARFNIGAGLYAEGVTGTDKGAGTINATAYYLNGTVVGSIIQRVYSEVTSSSSTAAVIPLDTSRPQSGEGAQLITATVTPTSAASRLRIRANLPTLSKSTTGTVIVALFQDATANALAATALSLVSGNYGPIQLFLEMDAGTTSATTFKIRIGCNTGSVAWNDAFGASSVVSMTIDEVTA